MQSSYRKLNISRYLFLRALLMLAAIFIVRAASAVGSTDLAENVLPLATETVTETATAIATETTTIIPTASATVIVPLCEPGWKVMPAMNLGNGRGTIYDIEVISSDDVWAVGEFAAGTYSETRGLIMHWDGAIWSRVDAPELGLATSLYSISASSANDIWAVGRLRIESEPNDPNFDMYTFTLHWDGTAWMAISTPPVTLSDSAHLDVNPINAVVALSPNDAWAAGYEFFHNLPRIFWTAPVLLRWDGVQWNRVTCQCYEYIDDMDVLDTNNLWTLSTDYEDTNSHMVSHWDGSTWTQIPLPVVNGAQFEDMEVVSANSIWVVGSVSNGTGGYTPVSLHWNGSTWENIPIPLSESARLFSIDARADSDVWAVGEAGCADYSTCIETTPLVLRWDGVQWSRQTAPQPGSLAVVEAPADGSVWAGGSIGEPWFVYWDGTAWSQQPSLLQGENSNFLNGIEAISPTDIWAVGGYEKAKQLGGKINRTLAQRWDGVSWSVIPTANEPYDSYLNAVSAVASDDIWAVGGMAREDGEMLIEHWDGTQWTIVPGPTLLKSALSDVEAIASDNVWAVGTEDAGTTTPKPILLHWDGTQWSRVEGPVTTGSLYGVDALSADDIWAVGQGNQGLILHWDGTAWTSGQIGTEGLTLYSVAALSGTDVWAVGWSGEGDPGILHWDGTTWEVVSGPEVLPGVANRLKSVVAQGDDIWVAGNYTDEAGVVKPLLLRYDGTVWTVIETAEVEAESSTFNDLAVIDPQNIWTVGSYNTELSQRVLIEHYPTLFTDVMPGSTFYPFIRCLWCRGIINGYDDGSFRPNNALTRGQLAKIVSNAAGFSEPPGAQIFEDVVPGSTFYDFVQRLAGRGHIQGYPCGGPNEPCGAGNLPYFRPNGNASRGQISKIVSEAAGLTGRPNRQMFEDVPPGSTFYDFIQRLAELGVMSGYPCGGASEPCGPGNLPYFRPGNNATRGQTAKIVSNTFFPECEPSAK